MRKNKGKTDGFGGIGYGVERLFGYQISFQASLSFEGMKEGEEGGMMGSIQTDKY